MAVILLVVMVVGVVVVAECHALSCSSTQRDTHQILHQYTGSTGLW